MKLVHLLSKSQLDSVDDNPDNKVHGANMGPIWGRQDPGGPHVGPMDFAIWEELNAVYLRFKFLWYSK